MTWAEFMSDWSEEGAEVTDGMTNRQATNALVVLLLQHCAECPEVVCARRAYQKIWDQQSENANEYHYLDMYLLFTADVAARGVCEDERAVPPGGPLHPQAGASHAVMPGLPSQLKFATLGLQFWTPWFQWPLWFTGETVFIAKRTRRSSVAFWFWWTPRSRPTAFWFWWTLRSRPVPSAVDYAGRHADGGKTEVCFAVLVPPACGGKETTCVFVRHVSYLWQARAPGPGLPHEYLCHLWTAKTHSPVLSATVKRATKRGVGAPMNTARIPEVDQWQQIQAKDPGRVQTIRIRFVQADYAAEGDARWVETVILAAPWSLWISRPEVAWRLPQVP